MPLDHFTSATLRLFKGTLSVIDPTGNGTLLPHAQLLLLTTSRVAPPALPASRSIFTRRSREATLHETRTWLVDMTHEQRQWATRQMQETSRYWDLNEHTVRVYADQNPNAALQKCWVRQLSDHGLSPRIDYGHALLSHAEETFVSAVCAKTEIIAGTRACDELRQLLADEHLPGL